MLDKEFIQKMKQRLEEEKTDVEQKIADLKKPEKPMENPELDDLAQDAAKDILEESSLSAFEIVLEKIDSALDRIKKNKYGICVKTGKEIPKERLELEPWADQLTSNE